MPIFDFVCECGKTVERLVKSHESEVMCECGKKMVSKMTSAPSFRLTGTGWYATDFKKGK